MSYSHADCDCLGCLMGRMMVAFVGGSFLTFAIAEKFLPKDSRWFVLLGIAGGVGCALIMRWGERRQRRKAAERAAKERADNPGPSAEDIVRFAAFERTFDILSELFGPRSNLSCVRTRGELSEIHVECRHCGQRNRLYRQRPLMTAICGACKKHLCVQPGERAAIPKDDKPVESKVVN